MNAITVVHVGGTPGYTSVPIQTLLRVMLSDGYCVDYIGCSQGLASDIRAAPNFKGYDLPLQTNQTVFGKVQYRMATTREVKRLVELCMQDSDVLWTTSMNTMCALGKDALKYKNVLQLLELARYAYAFKRLIRFPIDEYARQSWKTVTCEINRAYIQKVWWNLPKTPYVLPNKPFSLDPGTLTPETEAAIERMKQEKKKIALYLGGVYADRNFEECAKALQKSGEYVLYIAARITSKAVEAQIEHLTRDYQAVYLGGFTPPNHLALVQYARVGLLPYKPVKGVNSELNALYCAPNKIFEYAGFGVPMVGSDVLGLRQPFEQWNIGRCCDFNSEEAILQAIKAVDQQHNKMSANCYKFYDSVDLHKIVADILAD